MAMNLSLSDENARGVAMAAAFYGVSKTKYINAVLSAAFTADPDLCELIRKDMRIRFDRATADKRESVDA